MGLAEKHDIPTKPVAAEPWTFKRLFPFSGAVTNIAKVFVNPLDVLLGYLVIMLGIAELIGRHVSWQFWVLTLLILGATVFQRYTGIPSAKEEKKK